MRLLEEFSNLYLYQNLHLFVLPLTLMNSCFPCGKVGCYVAPDDVVFLLVSPQYGRAFLSGPALILMDVGGRWKWSLTEAQKHPTLFKHPWMFVRGADVPPSNPSLSPPTAGSLSALPGPMLPATESDGTARPLWPTGHLVSCR